MCYGVTIIVFGNKPDDPRFKSFMRMFVVYIVLIFLGKGINSTIVRPALFHLSLAMGK